MKSAAFLIEGRATAVGEKIAVADNSFSRFLGLMGRRSIEPGSGMWITPSSGVHTFWMRMRIDVVALDSEMRVINVWHAVRPWRLCGVSLKTRSILELPAGHIQSCGIERGDVMRVQLIE